MSSPVSVFLDFNLPNATTWFYFSWLLAVALFFKFSRVLSIRNWDVVTLFLLVPGFLALQAARPSPVPSPRHPAVQVANLVGLGAGPLTMPASAFADLGAWANASELTLNSPRWIWWGYLWLLCGSGYLFARCLFDLALAKRPALTPNLSSGGLAWFAGALFVCLSAVALRPPEFPAGATPSGSQAPPPTTPVGKEGVPFTVAKQGLGAGASAYYWQRGFAILGHLAVVVGLVVIGRLHFQDSGAGMAAATFYLMLPYTGIHVGEAHHVWPTALVVWAVASFRLPMLAGALLGLAASTMYFPVVLAPLWAGFYWKRGVGRFVFAFVAMGALCLTAAALNLWLRGQLEASIGEAFEQTAWQPWRVPTTEGFWTGVHWAYRIPIFVAYAIIALGTAIWPWPKNLAHLIALSAALLVGIQFWYADHGGVYVLWYLPLLLLLVFRPNLEDARPSPIDAERDWLARAGRNVGRLFTRVFRPRIVEAVKQ